MSAEFTITAEMLAAHAEWRRTRYEEVKTGVRIVCPPGAIVVRPDDPETRKAVAEALAPYEHECLDGAMRVMATAGEIHRAVLAALKGVNRG